MTIEKLTISDYEKVHDFYFKIIDGFEGKAYSPKREKDVYPAPEQLQELLEKGEMLLGLKFFKKEKKMFLCRLMMKI